MQQNAEKPRKDRNLTYFHGEAATSAVEEASGGYQPSVLIASGADAKGVASMSTLINLLLSLVYMKETSIIERIGSTKRGAVVLSLVNVIIWLPILLVLFFIGPVSPILFTGLWIVNLIPGLLVSPLRDSWLAASIPASRMGRYLGMRQAISSVAYLSTFFVMGYMLDLFRGQIFTGFAAVFAIAFIAACGSLILYRVIHALPADTEQQKVNFGFRDFIRETRRGSFGRFIRYVLLFNFSVSLGGPLYAVYMIRDLDFSYLALTAVLSAEYVGRVLSGTFWGRYADKVGNIKTIGIVSHLIPFVPILWLFSSSVTYLIIVQLLSGTLWAAFDLCRQSYIYKAAPKDKRLRYIVYHKSLSLLSMALGGLLGAFLVIFMFPIFGNKILGVFLVSGLFRLIVVKSMFNKLIDLSLPYQSSPAMAWDTVGEMVSSGQGLYYRPQDWARFAPSDVGAVPSRQSLYSRPQDWARFAQAPLVPQPAFAKVDVGAVPSRQSLYSRPQDWARFAQAPLVPQPAFAKADVGIAPSRQGMYYRPQDWARFAQAPLVPQPAFAKADVRTAPSGQGLQQHTWDGAQFTRRVATSSGAPRWWQARPALSLQPIN